MALSIANRIFLGFAAVIAVMAVLGFYALNQISDVRATMETVVSRDIAILHQLDRVKDGERHMRTAREAAVTRFLLKSLGREASGGEDTLAVRRRLAAAAEATLNETVALANDYRVKALSAERADAWRRLGQSLTDASGALRQIREEGERQFEAMAAGDLAGVLAREAALRESRVGFVRDLETAGGIVNEGIAAGERRVAAVYDESRASVLGALALAVILSIAIAVLIRRSIVRPLGAFMDFVEQVGQGNLAGEPAATGRTEFGRLGKTLNVMVEGLRRLALQSREATGNLNAAAAEIRASTQQQAASVEEQLAAVQETAATVDEITHSGAQIGQRAQEVIASAQATAQTSTAGLRAVEDTAKAMDSIRDQAEAVAETIVALSEKTQAIGDIIATVNDISERSHLLALNAAIEAAAAGESGRSFAVVAAEMKALADQAKEATGQVRSILGDIQRGIDSSVMMTEEAVKRVAAGKERTDTTHRTIEEMTGRIQDSVQTFQQIVASTNQQQIGIEQVMGALQNIRQASQQTAASTRQLDAAAADLTSLSGQLVALTERYRL